MSILGELADMRLSNLLRWMRVLALAALAWGLRLAPAVVVDPQAQTRAPAGTGLGFREYDIPTPNSYPGQLELDPQGNVWISEQAGNKIARFDPATAKFTEYLIPVPASSPWGLELDAQGRVWVALQSAHAIACYDEAGQCPTAGDCAAEGDWSVCTPGTPASEPVDVAVGQDGSVWFTERAGKKLGCLAPDTGLIKEYDPAAQVQPPLPDPVVKPWSIAASGRNIWFTDPDGQQALRFYITLGRFYAFYTPTSPSTPQTVVLTQGGQPWFTERTANKIALFYWDTNGQWLEAEIPTSGSEPYGIALDIREEVWFTEKAGNKLGHFAGTLPLAEYSLPTPGSQPSDVKIDADGCVWYAAPGANRIGRLCRYSLRLPLIRRTKPGG